MINAAATAVMAEIVVFIALLFVTGEFYQNPRTETSPRRFESLKARPRAAHRNVNEDNIVIVHKWQLTQMFTNHKWQIFVLVAIVNN